MQASAVIGFKGQVVIPARLRKKYGLRVGRRVVFSEQGGKLTLEPANFGAFLDLCGVLKGASLVRDFEEERSTEKTREHAR
jgi:AbrB family looped-hinge helix DNA binding protein